MEKNQAASVGDIKDMGLVGRSPRKGNGYPLRILAWRIPRTEEPDGL